MNLKLRVLVGFCFHEDVGRRNYLSIFTAFSDLSARSAAILEGVFMAEAIVKALSRSLARPKTAVLVFIRVLMPVDRVWSLIARFFGTVVSTFF